MKLFVYGTLQKGFWNNRLLQKSKFLGRGSTSPNFTLISLGGFPGLLDHGGTKVTGEVWEVDDETLTACDQLEGHPNWYRRTPVTLEDGTEVETYIYLKPSKEEAGRVVISGDWKAHTGRV